MKLEINKYQDQIKTAIQIFWDTRNKQKGANTLSNRSAVTAGKQLDGFIDLLVNIAQDIGVPEDCIFKKGNHIPGYFRPTKDWDFLIISPNKKLISVIELKSQVGSFGNNFNNRTEEALGSAIDFWTAFREKAYPNQIAPWVGYLMLIEKSDKSTKPVRVSEPHFQVFKDFIGASYIDRYEMLCKKLILERHYTHCCLLWSQSNYSFGNVAEDISIEAFLQSFVGHLFGQMNEFKIEKDG